MAWGGKREGYTVGKPKETIEFEGEQSLMHIDITRALDKVYGKSNTDKNGTSF